MHEQARAHRRESERLHGFVVQMVRAVSEDALGNRVAAALARIEKAEAGGMGRDEAFLNYTQTLDRSPPADDR